VTRFLLVLALVVLVIAALGPLLRALHRARRVRELPQDELVKDPVCQTYVLASRAVTSEVGGVVTHFCSRECAARFARGEGRA
jgi:YHS domain-containing protein